MKLPENEAVFWHDVREAWCGLGLAFDRWAVREAGRYARHLMDEGAYADAIGLAVRAQAGGRVAPLPPPWSG